MPVRRPLGTVYSDIDCEKPENANSCTSGGRDCHDFSNFWRVAQSCRSQHASVSNKQNIRWSFGGFCKTIPCSSGESLHPFTLLAFARLVPRADTEVIATACTPDGSY